MTTKEVAKICGVTDRTVSGNAKKAGVVLENGKTHDWTEEEVKRLQLVLMGNQVKQGVQVETVKSTVASSFKAGLTIQELIRSGNVEAIKEFTQMAIEAAEQQNALIEAQEQNKLLLEQKEKAEAETARIYQYNKNFHSNLYTDIAKKFGITPNMVGRIANENGLKQDPIYGKLGKIQLNNGKWVNQFYYNEDALTVIKSFVLKYANIIK